MRAYWILILVLMTPSAWSGGIPTVDLPGLIEATRQRQESIKIWLEEKRQTQAWIEEKYRDVEEIREMYEQTRKLQEQINNLNGDYLKGFLLNDGRSKRQRRQIARSLGKMKDSYFTAEELAEEFDIPIEEAREYAAALSYIEAADAQLARGDDQITEAELLTEAIDDDVENKAALDLVNRNLNKIQTDRAEQGKTLALILAQQSERDLRDLLRRATDKRMCR